VISIFLYFWSALKRPLSCFSGYKTFFNWFDSRANNIYKINDLVAYNYDASHIYRENLIFIRHIPHLGYD